MDSSPRNQPGHLARRRSVLNGAVQAHLSCDIRTSAWSTDDEGSPYSCDTASPRYAAHAVWPASPTLSPRKTRSPATALRRDSTPPPISALINHGLTPRAAGGGPHGHPHHHHHTQGVSGNRVAAQTALARLAVLLCVTVAIETALGIFGAYCGGEHPARAMPPTDVVACAAACVVLVACGVVASYLLSPRKGWRGGRSGRVSDLFLAAMLCVLAAAFLRCVLEVYSVYAADVPAGTSLRWPRVRALASQLLGRGRHAIPNSLLLVRIVSCDAALAQLGYSAVLLAAVVVAVPRCVPYHCRSLLGLPLVAAMLCVTYGQECLLSASVLSIYGEQAVGAADAQGGPDAAHNLRLMVGGAVTQCAGVAAALVGVTSRRHVTFRTHWPDTGTLLVALAACLLSAGTLIRTVGEAALWRADAPPAAASALLDASSDTRGGVLGVGSVMQHSSGISMPLAVLVLASATHNKRLQVSQDCGVL